jgi:hypothetical protein
MAFPQSGDAMKQEKMKNDRMKNVQAKPTDTMKKDDTKKDDGMQHELFSRDCLGTLRPLQILWNNYGLEMGATAPVSLKTASLLTPGTPAHASIPKAWRGNSTIRAREP